MKIRVYVGFKLDDEGTQICSRKLDVRSAGKLLLDAAESQKRLKLSTGSKKQNECSRFTGVRKSKNIVVRSSSLAERRGN